MTNPQTTPDQAAYQSWLYRRPERAEQQDQIVKACHIRDLTTRHVRSFQQACAAMDTTMEKLIYAFDWMMTDNEAINADHDTHKYRLARHERESYLWLLRLCGAGEEG